MSTKAIRRVAGLVALGLAIGGGNVVAATTLTTHTTADNAFDMYLSTSDSVAGTLFAQGNSWGTNYVAATALTPNVTNYIHVVGTDWGHPAAYIGDFTLSNANFRFANGTQTLLTNTSDWKVSATGFGSNYRTPVFEGLNGIGPWGNRSTIASGAAWIWYPETTPVYTAYFSTAITPIPEPDILALMMTGLGFLGCIARRRKMFAAVNT